MSDHLTDIVTAESMYIMKGHICFSMSHDSFFGGKKLNEFSTCERSQIDGLEKSH